MLIGWPSITDSASMPPTPHPVTPSPLIMVVCESVPTSESGYSSAPSLNTVRARCSRFTWWTMPAPGGTTARFWNALEPHLRNWKRSLLRSNSISAFFWEAPATRAWSTCTEWSITRSTGTWGLMSVGSPPRHVMASRIAARSTTQGTPVKSCSSTRAGLKGISICWGQVSCQFKMFSTSLRSTWNSSQLRTALSNSTLIEYGKDSTRLSFRASRL
mmetsp:Transcript_6772/g.12870  ORF Transcript_6772/g.12870 Transcript_6772/m.12870 type:complete len:216 (+) Transcript_6772:2433-3080(+)